MPCKWYKSAFTQSLVHNSLRIPVSMHWWPSCTCRQPGIVSHLCLECRVLCIYFYPFLWRGCVHRNPAGKINVVSRLRGILVRSGNNTSQDECIAPKRSRKIWFTFYSMFRPPTCDNGPSLEKLSYCSPWPPETHLRYGGVNCLQGTPMGRSLANNMEEKRGAGRRGPVDLQSNRKIINYMYFNSSRASCCALLKWHL